ncbi:MAG: DUF2860 family protein [Gammaproteobacteria bacterium]|nr:DUF2860 family protein [Gammaproteobacteria bacterium]
MNMPIRYHLFILFSFLWLSLVFPGAATAQDSAELQAEFESALKAIEEDRLRTAKRTLHELLARQPKLQRARLELARAYYLSYDYEEAEKLAEQVLEDPNTPPAVQTTVLAFLAQIRADQQQVEKRNTWTPSIYAGLMYDSNVNFGPSRDVIDINGIPGIIAGASRQREDGAFVVNPGLGHTYNPNIRFESGEHTGFFVWQSELSGYYRKYFDENDYNFGVIRLRSGPTWLVPNQWRASIAVQGDQIWLDNSRLAFFTSLNPTFSWEATEDTTLTIDGYLTDRNYNRDIDDGRDGLYKWVELSANHFLKKDTLSIQAGIGYGDLDADEDRFAYKGPQLFVGFVANAWENGFIHSRVRYRKFDYEGEEPLYNVSRDDDEYQFTLGFEHDIQTGFLKNWSVLGDWIYTDNQSDDVEIFKYDRHEVNLGLSRNF